MSERSLFDRPGLDGEPPTIQARFEQFDREHPDVYALFKRFAQELRDGGREHYGARAIMERIRWHMATSSQGTADFKINDHYAPRYARKLIAECPEFAEFFELRRLKTL
jgi:hypothetical protein